MTDSEAEVIYNYIKSDFKLVPRKFSWDDIKEVEPDEWDLAMLKEIKENPDCHAFVSQDELMEELELDKP